MMWLVWTLVVLAAVAAVALAIWTSRRREAVRREAFEAVAARRGWSFTLTRQSLGRPGTMRLAARHGLDWSVLVDRPEESNRRTRPLSRTTRFFAPDCRWDQGLMLIMPAEALTSPPDAGPRGRDAARQFAHALPADIDPDLLAALQPVQTDASWVLLASTDPSRRFDLRPILDAMDQWQADMRPALDPVHVSIGPQGLSVILRHAIARADRMERFVDFGIGIARIS